MSQLGGQGTLLSACNRAWIAGVRRAELKQFAEQGGEASNKRSALVNRMARAERAIETLNDVAWSVKRKGKCNRYVFLVQGSESWFA